MIGDVPQQNRIKTGQLFSYLFYFKVNYVIVRFIVHLLANVYILYLLDVISQSF